MLNILSEQTLTRENYSATCCVVALERGFLVLITDQKNFGIGNVTLSSPPVIEGIRAMSTPAPLFGLEFKQNILSKMVSELCAEKLKKPCLVLVHVKGLKRKELFVSKCIIDSLKKTLEECLKKI